MDVQGPFWKLHRRKLFEDKICGLSLTAHNDGKYNSSKYTGAPNDFFGAK